ncbi:molybdopterin-binding protein [Aurantimonas sp. MSK8Z-1]|uniref:molybdopterin-binding protein n=1 Tax=Mangrovibrevibacter kandeliae TaxID=2968473 RepID=UPI002118F0D0|nr:molybdopterin-binding protein [Aurantimonas sp. MSK8Z-1]MCW4114795.1 molybdopterin-binding protein [Aurantimonas sp. MSK8Z-1]
MAELRIPRRRFLTGAALAASGAALSGCFDDLADRGNPVRGVLASAERLTYEAQRLLLGADALAPEYAASEVRQAMRPNGTTGPRDPEYRRLAAAGFTDWRLSVTGLVERELSLSLGEITNMPSRSQITRHDCVEGWSCIASWTGVPLARVLDEAGVKPAARYVVFHCFDTMENGFTGPVRYYESIDLRDARHPQTILAYALNGTTLPVSNGAPLRLRVERQLGYKMAKYLRAIELTDRLSGFGDGMGGYWEDRGYEWFAGI